MAAFVDVLNVSPFDENTYLVGDPDTGVAVVIDPGGRAGDVVRAAERRGVRVTAIVCTHTHIDHVAAVDSLRDLSGAPFLIHKDAEALLAALPRQAAMFGLRPVPAPHVDGYLDERAGLRVGGLALEVRSTPGHAPGHVALLAGALDYDGGVAPAAFVGDVIFLGSIGRTDLDGGDYHVLMTSIEQQVLSLPDETVLLSGHGPATTVGHERRFNPFVADWRRGRPSAG